MQVKVQAPVLEKVYSSSNKVKNTGCFFAGIGHFVQNILVKADITNNY